MGAVAENKDIGFVFDCSYPAKAVVVFLSAVTGRSGHHMPRVRIVPLDLPHKVRSRFISSGSDQHGEIAGIVLKEQAAHSGGHTLVSTGHGHDHADHGPAVVGQGTVGRLIQPRPARQGLTCPGQNIE